MEVKKIAVIGAGTMGNGIAQVFAQHGYPVVMIDVKDEFVQRGMGAVEKSLARLVKKEVMDDKTKAEVIGRIKGSTSLKDAASVDLVVEAVLEDFAVKKKVFKELDALLGKDAILSTNTSS
ncbi:MAG: 3-hydroxyacyl-CoA dehydrogenase NAD-binding domain-containing protein, partial [Candidatus Krumholzibacteria bacterium]|nr:3-hydroxyacyl-CoA dehydrogenase NAD-binding domain-containing protein [Candidatus Krumholzibacteria bacterium]